MLRTLALVCAVFVLGVQATSQAARQIPALSVVSRAPVGEVAQLSDANDVRIMFSEPMVALGSAAVTGQPSWITITPVPHGHYFWSGTRTLIFSPDPETPFPYATTYHVRVDGAATSTLGHALGTAVAFEFTTPPVRLLQAMWYRKTGRYDDPVVVALRFNQPVRAADVAAHAHLHLAPHNWTPPTLEAEARARLEATDPAGLARFEAKVAAADRVAHSSDTLTARVADTWDDKRPGFERGPETVVLETLTAPPPEGTLAVEIDDRMPSPDGPATHAAQVTQQPLDHAFFVVRFTCVTDCNPAGYNGLQLRGGVPNGVQARALARAVSVQDVTRAGTETPVMALGPPDNPDQIASTLSQAGFPRQPPVSTWAVRIDPTLQALDGQSLGYPFVGLIHNEHESAGFALNSGVWESGGGPKLPLSSRNLRDLTVWTAPVTRDEIMPQLIALTASRFESVPPVASRVFPLTITPDLAEAHGLDVGPLLRPGDTGIVWTGVAPGQVVPMSASGPGTPRGAIVQVTNLGLSVKDSAQSTLVFVTRLDTAQPVAEARVSIVNASNQVVWAGLTGPDGVALAPALALRPTGLYRPPPAFIVTAEKDGDLAYVGSDWGTTVQPYQWQLGYRQADRPVLRGAIFTDRGAYRTGEDVHVKSVLRRDALEGTAPIAAGTSFFVRVQDSRGRVLDHRTVTTNRWGSVEWTAHVPDSAALGSCLVVISTEPPDPPGSRPTADVVTGSFLVAAYRQPDFRVDTTVTAEPPVLGGTLHGVVEAKYLFGQALDSRPVRWWITRRPVVTVPPPIRERFDEATFAFGYLPDLNVAREARVAEQNETLDPSGRVDVPIPTVPDVDFAFTYEFNGEVTSVAAQHIAGHTALVVHPADVYVGLKRPAMFVDVKAGATTEVVVSDLSGRPLPAVPVTVSLAREEWTYAPAGAVGGRASLASGVWERKETPVGEWTLRSAAMPVPLVMPFKEGGAYVVHARAADSTGRQTRTDLRFYGIGGGASVWRMDGNKIQLVPERATWRPAESARLMIQSPWAQATALLTVEREGVRRYRQFQIASTQDTVDVPLMAGDVPNVFVSVLLVKGRTADALAPDGTDAGPPAFRVGYTMLTVDDASKRLDVAVSSDRETYLPHASAKVSVVVKGPDGRPAASEVALWAVDYGLLSLTGYSTPDVLKAIYARRDLQVLTEDTRERMISRRPLVVEASGAQGQGFGGGRGGAGLAAREAWNLEGGNFSTDQVLAQGPAPMYYNYDAFTEAPGAGPAFTFRKDFRPVVFWLGSTTTDSAGRATTDVTLPDSLTTYRIMAVADEPDRFGSGEHEVRVTKPLTLLPAFPRFLSRGDRAWFGATVTNGSRTGGDAVVTVRSLNGTALEFEAPSVATLHLAAGETAPVLFGGIARLAAPVRVQMTVTLGAETDAFETTLPVTMPARLETVAAYGDTTSRAVEKLMLPAGALPGAGGLAVTLASTALVGLGESVRYMNEYPYENAEAKASRALALVFTADLGSAFPLPDVKPDAYRARAGEALDALYGFQCGDGGLAFWAGQCRSESAYLTAYVLDVWHTARTLQLSIDQGAVDRGLNYLQGQARQQPPEIRLWPAWAASQAYSVKVLTEFGRNAAAGITQLDGVAERMPMFALSYLADAMAASGERGVRYQDVVRRLTNSLRIEADRAHVEELDDDALTWLWTSNVRATAVVLEGLARRQDDGTLAAPLARWLLASRTNGRWGTTSENATALAALVSYYRTFESDAPQMTATVKVGSATVGTASFAGRTTASQEFVVPMPDLARAVAGAASDLEVARTGTGRVYYTSRLQYLAPEPPEAVDRGIHVDRRLAVFAHGEAGAAATSFAQGDVIRVTVTVTLPAEGKFLVVEDRLPAGVEAIDESLSTTALDLARQATTTSPGSSGLNWWRFGGFDHVEKHDDHVLAFATRLAAGRHEFSYLVRATTAGTFTAAGAHAEALYAPELGGRSAAAVVSIR